MQPCPELLQVADGTQGEAERVAAQTVADYGVCAARTKGWQKWAQDSEK
ncbi:MAG: hypothetical protein Q7K57_24985 [Burkholderiaceae bacterium]|nr:hypothetical protein [Burkholderiaceae bacterium]